MLTLFGPLPQGRPWGNRINITAASIASAALSCGHHISLVYILRLRHLIVQHRSNHEAAAFSYWYIQSYRGHAMDVWYTYTGSILRTIALPLLMVHDLKGVQDVDASSVFDLLSLPSFLEHGPLGLGPPRHTL